MKMYRFELSGAPSLPDGQRLMYPSKGVPDPEVAPISSALLMHHFRSCLIWHVSGFGRGAGK